MNLIYRGSRYAFLLVVAMAGVSSVPEQAQSQQRIEITSRPTCPRCTIQLVPVATLGDADGPGALGTPSVVAMDRQGYFYVSTMEASGEFVVFSSAGKYVKTVGRRGSGPGEFRFIRRIVPYGDKVHVFDSGLNRWSTLGSEGEVVTSATIPTPLGALVLNDSLTLVNAKILSRELVGVPLHLVSVKGEILRSFGADGTVFRLDIPLMGWRQLAKSGSDRIWAAYLTQYVIDQWDVEGNKRIELARQADWFKPHFRGAVESRTDDAPSPWIAAIHEDRQGRLWTLVAVADPNYNATLERRQMTDGIRYIPKDLNRYFDTVIEVIDPKAGRLIASQRLDQHITHFLDADHVAGYREMPDGTPVISVWRVQLVQP